MTATGPGRAAPVRVGLIGAGGIGRAHAKAVESIEGATLTAVSDVDPLAAEAVANDHGADAIPIEEIADPARIDIVVIASPPATHPALVELVLLANIPVLCEKPLAIDRLTAQRLADLSESTGTPLTMATKFRFVEEVNRTRELASTGQLGEIVKVEVTFGSRVEMAHRWNSVAAVSGGGVLIDNATHAVDLVRYLTGDLTDVLVAAGPTTQPVQVEDSASMLARTESGVLAQIDVTWSFRRLSPVYLAVHGSHGTVEVGWQGARAVTIDDPEPFTFGTGYNKIDSLRANLATVLDAVAAGKPPEVTARDAVATAAVIDAGYASMRTGRWTAVEHTP